MSAALLFLRHLPQTHPHSSKQMTIIQPPGVLNSKKCDILVTFTPRATSLINTTY
jgi:hypothetical protein